MNAILSHRYRILLAGVTGCALIGLSLALIPGCFNPQQSVKADPVGKKDEAAQVGGGQSIRVKVVRPTKELLKRTTTLPAHVDGYEKTDLFARVAGYLRKVNVDIGDRVEKDAVLAELWIPEMDQELLQKAALVDQAKAMLAQADANLVAAAAFVEASKAAVEETKADLARITSELAYRKIEYERYVQLRKENAIRTELVDEKYNQYRAAAAGLVSANAKIGSAKANVKVEEAKHLKAKADVESARSNVRVADSNVEHMRILLKYGKIEAPYKGVITRRYVDTGALIRAAANGKTEPLFSIVRTDRLRIHADIAEADSGLVKKEQPGILRVDALLGRQFPGKIVRFADALDRGTRTMRVELELDVHDDALRPGMFGTVTIELANQADAIMLNTNVLLPASGKPAVMVVENGRAKRREIVIGANDGIRMHVREGLKGDEEVISEGKNVVRDGQAVEIVR